MLIHAHGQRCLNPHGEIGVQNLPQFIRGSEGQLRQPVDLIEQLQAIQTLDRMQITIVFEINTGATHPLQQELMVEAINVLAYQTHPLAGSRFNLLQVFDELLQHFLLSRQGGVAVMIDELFRGHVQGFKQGFIRQHHLIQPAVQLTDLIAVLVVQLQHGILAALQTKGLYVKENRHGVVFCQLASIVSQSVAGPEQFLSHDRIEPSRVCLAIRQTITSGKLGYFSSA